MRGLCLCLVLAGMTFAAEDPSKGGDIWPLFRGNPEQTGVANTKLPDTLKVVWQYKAKDGVEGTAAIAGGTVFIGSFDKHLHAIDLKTGKPKWKYGAGPIKSPPGIRDGVVYVGDEDGGFHAIDAQTGRMRWKFDAGSEVTSGTGFAGDDILFGTSGETLFCLTKDGKKKWEFKVAGGPVHATPAVVGTTTFVAGCDSALHVIDTRTGKELRSIELAGQVGATGALAGDIIYVGTMTNEVQAIDWKQGKVLWTYRAEKRQQPFQASVALTDTLVLAGSKDKRLHAIDRKTGEAKWTYLTDGRIDSSPVVVGKRVYFGTLDGKFMVLDREKGTLVQKLDLDSEIVGSPAVADGRIIIATVKGNIYCLGE
jgi:outer membrane protein assembly factor BamB